jgi:hypothetical protein
MPKTKHLLTKHPLLTFAIMLMSSLVFGLSSYNIFYLVKANVTLVFDYGLMALLDGALKELFLLTFYGIISLAAYVVFKACEKWLVDKLLK